MLGAIKRVISGESFERGENPPNSEQPQQPQPQQPAPILVENDMDIDAPLPLDSVYSPRSSLSDMSAAERQAEAQAQARVIVGGMTRTDVGQQAVTDLVNTVMHVPLGRVDSKASTSDSSSSVKGSSQNSSRDWGWFEDVHASEPSLKRTKDASGGTTSKKKGKHHGLVPSTGSDPLVDAAPHRNPETDAAAMAVTAPTYVLEESISSQRLWKDTAGQRPPQPLEERAFFEKMWAQNFARSQVEYRMPVEVLTATTPISLSPFADGNFKGGNELSNYNLDQGGSASGGDSKGNTSVAEAALMRNMNEPSRILNHHNEGDGHEVVNRTVKGTGSDGDLTILVKGDNVFGTTVSKSFARPSENGGPIAGVDTVNISIASYRVVESKKHGKYAQFLVIYREGSIQDTIGVWKRYSDFQELSKKVTQAHEGCAAVIANMSPLAVTEEHEVEHLPNAITSWRLLKKRQRWYRCLDAGYLSLKVFLLERFLHDILFESSSPNLLRDFVGVEP